jgi:integrase
VAPALGSVKAVDLDPARMQYMVDTMRKAGRSPSVIRATVRIISTTYRQAIVLKIVTENPATGIVLPRYTPAARDTWTADDIDKILTTLRTDAKWMAVYRLCLATGIRPGEMLALKWADLDLANGRVTIRRTVTRTADRKLIIGTKTKTDKDRTIALSSSVIAALKAWRPQQVAERLAAKSWSDNDLILAGTKGELMHPSTWWRYHRDLCERAGVKRIALHSLRHTFATIALERNIHPKIVQEMLGHASIQITLDLYTHLSVDLQSAAAESLDAHLFGIQDQQKGIT